MTPLEKVRKCARLMGIQHSVQTDRDGIDYVRREKYPGDGNSGEYDPLHDKDQAMDLVIRFGLASRKKDGIWRVDNESYLTHAWNSDLLAAIVDCVAAMPEGE